MESMYDTVYQVFLDDVNSLPEREDKNFIAIWTAIIKGLTDERFNTMPVVFDILKLSATYIDRLVLNDDNKAPSVYTLFEVRKRIEKIEDTNPQTKPLTEDLKNKIMQSCESLLGQSTSIAQLKPNLNTPDALFAESYSAALSVYELYA